MVTTQFSKNFGQVVHLSTFFGHPFIYEKSTLSVSPHFASNTSLMFFVILLQFLFLLVQVIRFKLANDSSQLNFLVPVLYGVFYVSFSIAVFAFTPYEAARQFNSVLRFRQAVQDRYLSRKESDAQLLCFDKYWTVTFYVSLLVPVVSPAIALLHIVFASRNPIHVVSIFPSGSTMFKLLLIPYAVATAFWVLFIAFFLQILVLIGMCSIFLLAPIVGGIKFPKNSNKKMATLRSLSAVTHLYRSYQLLVKLTNQVYGWCILPSQFTLGKFVVVGGYLLVTEFRTEGMSVDGVSIFILGGCVPMVAVVWSGFITCCGFVHSQSKRVIGSWRNAKWEGKIEKASFKAFKKSCKPVFIGIPAIFEVKGDTVVKFNQGIVQGMFRALLTLK
ncbi:hypothetical protein Fcan01_20504 [Folsomia candida]|uniref:Uncharacterized protein n=1 Tax=Folsomia candida TaxID=158441 RepID=A0A226DIQ5_FOLCA|nr:hypothetical protein Fcan01_20504 [Folsomia candida]